MGYKKFKDGYARETTFGEESEGASTVIPDTNAVTYLWGEINRESIHPAPRTTTTFKPTSVGKQEVAAATDIYKNHYESTGMYGITAQNGILLQAVMGKSTTSDDTPSAGLYTHVIEPAGVTDGVIDLLPSFTIQHERHAVVINDWTTQYLGCKVSNLKLMCRFDDPRTLIFIVDWIAKKAFKVDFILTTDPVLPPAKNETTFLFANLTRKFRIGAGEYLTVEGLKQMELSINPGLLPEYSRSSLAGVDTSMWPKAFTEANRKDYTLMLQLHPETSMFWEEVIDSGNIGDFRFVWPRHDTDDYIQCDLLDCHFIWHEEKTPLLGTELIVEVICKPRACSFTVVDTIPKTHYGEV